MVKKECLAPSGKLGIVIENSVDGPRIYEVKMNSVLKNLIFRGDTIIAIDNSETNMMDASECTKLLLNNIGKKRRIQVLRPSVV